VDRECHGAQDKNDGQPFHENLLLFERCAACGERHPANVTLQLRRPRALRKVWMIT
jgi:hypothetical protein